MKLKRQINIHKKKYKKNCKEIVRMVQMLGFNKYEAISWIQLPNEYMENRSPMELIWEGNMNTVIKLINKWEKHVKENYPNTSPLVPTNTDVHTTGSSTTVGKSKNGNGKIERVGLRPKKDRKTLSRTKKE